MSADMFASTPGQLDEHERLRMYVEGVLERADRAVPWGPETVGVPASAGGSALMRLNDVAFYANARQEVSAFAALCLNLLALHRPRDAGGVSSGPACALRRCNCCMLRWPCPTVQEMTGLLK
ncbi:hypothetical protein EV190_108131 [Actinorugispora endophytica]|uniref:Uncharacterized protein n=2 Tax=Actinorugispora endophytica TaxID=1605990 RepID=A0A4R6UXL5_9ACTN|nr:hypothetical protein EV190_108131 [Actinorugispora endophytica]